MWYIQTYILLIKQLKKIVAPLNGGFLFLVMFHNSLNKNYFSFKNAFSRLIYQNKKIIEIIFYINKWYILYNKILMFYCSNPTSWASFSDFGEISLCAHSSAGWKSFNLFNIRLLIANGFHSFTKLLNFDSQGLT